MYNFVEINLFIGFTALYFILGLGSSLSHVNFLTEEEIENNLYASKEFKYGTTAHLEPRKFVCNYVKKT